MPDQSEIGKVIAPHFDAQFYRELYSDHLVQGEAEVEHYVRIGASLGFDPCAGFSSSFYLRANPDVVEAGLNPFWHFLVAGQSEGRAARPDINVELREAFDEKYYLRMNPDVAAAGADPFDHFMGQGWSEGRDPAVWFSTIFYRQQHAVAENENPLLHFLTTGRALGLRTHPFRQLGGYCVQDDIRHFTNPSVEWHEQRDPTIASGRRTRARALALYLPQFHPIPENDQWWGKGFTEWRNVGRGTPRFKGHFQPRIPEELGNYDLRDGITMPLQVQMAKEAGLEGFCFYYYWFNGRRVLEKPLEAFLKDQTLDCSFAILWANEDWTRRWDGLDTDVLLHQDYGAGDDEAFMADLARHFRDRRYFRVKGRPLFVIYRPGLIPDARQTIQKWRDILQEKHGVTPWFFMSQGFGDTDPDEYGLDGAMEFPPHKVAQGLPSILSNLEVTDLRFTGHVVSYDDMMKNAAMSEPAPFPLLRGVAPSWDNDARRQGNGTTYHGSTPAKYQAWLSEAIDYARAYPFEGESIVFINAWNEWAEAAYLEPDVHFGAAYLNATARALAAASADSGKKKIVVFTHDAYRHGAQILVKNIVRVLTRRFGIEVAIVSLGDGPLLAEYRLLAPTYLVGNDEAQLAKVLGALRASGFASAIVNTTVSGRALPTLRKLGYFAVSLIHELPELIRSYGLEPEVRLIAELANLVVFPAEVVRSSFEGVAGRLDPNKCIIRPQGSYLPWNRDAEASAEFRSKLGLGDDCKLVINVGYADARKGFDIFIDAARQICQTRDDVHFVWVGNIDVGYVPPLLEAGLAGSPATGHVHLVPFTSNPVPIFEAADLFFLSSREDPFPTVVLEALKAGLPVVGLEGSGGSEALMRAFGRLAPRDDPAAIGSAILSLLDLPADQKALAARQRQREIELRYRFEDYVGDLVTMLAPETPRISAVVPNYRYAGFLNSRLDSIYDQTSPLFEVLVLDDASPDDSLLMLDSYRQKTGREFELIVNQTNSGSGYLQWAKGARLARGDLVWIAEADDLAEPGFLEAACRVLEDPDVAFVFCDSTQRDEADRPLADSYGYYFSTVDQTAFSQDFVMRGDEFVQRFLSVKNLILNVSSVVWRRDVLLRVLAATEADMTRLRVACDWKMYAEAALSGGKVGYLSTALNMHRRHSSSVTHSRNAQAHYDEIVEVQDYIAGRIALSADSAQRRADYRKELQQQFGLAEASTEE